MKKKLNVITWILFFLLLTVQCLQAADPGEKEYYSKKKNNNWRWTPSFGDVDHYVLEKSSDGGAIWIQLPDVANVLVDDKVWCTVTSENDEDYQLRVRAVGLNGGEGSNSFISQVMHVRLRPGTPEFVEEVEGRP